VKSFPVFPVVLAFSAGLFATSAVWAQAGNSRIFTVDYRKLVSRADLTYQKPASRSEEGMPVGNGRMGSLVWTSPTTLKFQINRNDVFANNSYTSSFERDEDYGADCGMVDIEFGESGEDVFTGPGFQQHLSAYDALATARGAGVSARVLAWPERDVMAVEIDDQRAQPGPVDIDLKMLRYVMQVHQAQDWELRSKHAVMVRTRSHTATSRLEIRDGRIILTQEFREGDYFDSSAVAIAVAGRRSKPRYLNGTTVRLWAAPGKGKFTVLIGSAATFDPKQDVGALALKELAAAVPKGFEAMAAGTQAWWHDFWTKSFVSLHSGDGVADDIERNYTYFVYLMGASSRGAYPPHFNSLIWHTNGDMRRWGVQYWWANLSSYYNGLPPANHLDLMQPMFHMYSGMYDSLAVAARQQWGSQGIWIPETTWFNGEDKLPDDLAAEMRELYLMRKPWDQRSTHFREVGDTKHPHNSRWNYHGPAQWVDGRWEETPRGTGPFGPVTHILSSGAKIAYLYWLEYEYTQDQAWLRDRAYPMLKGIAEFYRNFPNVRKEADGKYHIYHVNNHEPVNDAQDTQEEVSAMYGITGIVLRASEILNVDANMRPVWKEFLANLTPLTTNETIKTRKAGEPLIWVSAVPPAVKGDVTRPGLIPAREYDLCSLECGDPAMLSIAKATYDASGANRGGGFRGSTSAKMGRADDVKTGLPAQMLQQPNPETGSGFIDWPGLGKVGIMRNRLRMREGPGTLDAEHLGGGTETLHDALLQAVAPAPGGQTVIHVFPAWPKEWNAQYTLLARGAFLVSSSMRGGRVEFVELESQAGGECRLRNPWGEAEVDLFRNGKQSEGLRGGLLTFQTAKGEHVVVVPKGSSPDKVKQTVLAAQGL
jgi:hypothetical protein